MKKYLSSALFPLIAIAMSLPTSAVFAQSTQSQATSTAAVSCYTFTRNLGKGKPFSAQEAVGLSAVLSGAGLWATTTAITGFDSAVASAVSGFQLKYSAQILKPSGLTAGTGFVGTATRNQMNKLYGCSAVPVAPSVQSSTDTSGQCPAGYTCTVAKKQDPICPPGFTCALVTHADSSVTVTAGKVGAPIFTPTTLQNSSGNSAATWPFTFTIRAGSSPIYVSATPDSTVKIGTDLSGVPGVSGPASATRPSKIIPAVILQGDTNDGTGQTATGSFIIPAYSSRIFTVNVTEDNLNNQGGDGGASVQVKGVYYSAYPTASDAVTQIASEALVTAGLDSFKSSSVSLIGNNGAQFYALPPTE